MCKIILWETVGRRRRTNPAQNGRDRGSNRGFGHKNEFVLKTKSAPCGTDSTDGNDITDRF